MYLHQLSATQVVAQLAEGKLCASDIFEQQRARIEQSNGKYNAFVYVAPKPPEPKPDGLLKGLPISIKDQIHVAGMPCTSGYQDLQDFIPTEDAWVIKKLKQAGAQILGKTNLPPLAMDFQTFNSVHGQTRNPWNPDFTAGGSSGGSAAALAAGLTFLEIGADLGGSLRIPASFCGVCSLMPTVDRVSTQGTMTLLERANVELRYLPRVGPMARHVEDLALAWQVLSGEEFVAKTKARLAILPPHPDLPLHPQIAKMLDNLKQQMNNVPQIEVEVTGPSNFNWAAAWQAYGVVQGYQLGVTIPLLQRFIGRLMSQGAMRRSPTFIKPIQDGYRRQPKKYQQALETRTQLASILDDFLSLYDALVLPVTLIPAFKHIKPSFERGFLRDYDHNFDIDGQSLNYFETLTRLTTPFNLTGHPVVTIPAGQDDTSGVPIGIQLIGKRNSDNELLATAALLQNSGLTQFRPFRD